MASNFIKMLEMVCIFNILCRIFFIVKKMGGNAFKTESLEDCFTHKPLEQHQGYPRTGPRSRQAHENAPLRYYSKTTTLRPT